MELSLGDPGGLLWRRKGYTHRLWQKAILGHPSTLEVRVNTQNLPESLSPSLKGEEKKSSFLKTQCVKKRYSFDYDAEGP